MKIMGRRRSRGAGPRWTLATACGTKLPKRLIRREVARCQSPAFAVVLAVVAARRGLGQARCIMVLCLAGNLVFLLEVRLWSHCLDTGCVRAANFFSLQE